MIPIPRMSKVLYDAVYMRGGWDLSTPTLELYPGSLRDVQNFEMTATVAGGYSRIAGYERYDGQTSPSVAAFSLIQVGSFLNIPTVGQTLTGDTSGATGLILAVTASYIIITRLTLAFTNTEDLLVGATPIGTAVPTTVTLSPLLSAQYTQLAADEYRPDIDEVPGSGPVRGVVSHIVGGIDVVFAFRNNVGGTACDLYKSSVAGWVNVPFVHEVSFTLGGTDTPADGDTLTQGGVTALIKRVATQSGAWAGTAAGRFIITSIIGGNFIAGAATAGPATLVLSGAETPITMLPGGKFEFDIDNFSGQASTIRIYGCDGVNRGFEFDGETLVPITTGATSDTPTHVRVHKLHLFFAFGSSAIHSGIGTPFNWTSIAGASELTCGDIVTNFMQQPGSVSTAALGITTRSALQILYGTSSANWNKVPFNDNGGGIPYTAQLMNESYWMNSQGVVDLRSSLTFGNFRQATISTNIQDYLVSKRGDVACSVLNKTKNQYRILFDDGAFVMFTIINGKLAGATKGLYFDPMFCAWSSEASDLEERVFCGSSADGFVYKMDTGSSFDGEDIEAHLVFNWNAIRSPRIVKRFRRTSIEMQGNFYAAFEFGYSLGYGSAKLIQPPSANYTSMFTGAPAWDTFIWDAFVWDGVTLGPSEVRTTGRAVNIQVSIRCGTNYIHPFTVNSLIFHYSLGRGLR